MHAFSHCVNYHQLHCLHWRKRAGGGYRFPLTSPCFISFCLCLYKACDNPTSLADTPPTGFYMGKISNHSKQIISAPRTWKINVLGGGSCMTIRDSERWGMLPVRYGHCAPPLLSFSAWEVSCHWSVVLQGCLSVCYKSGREIAPGTSLPFLSALTHQDHSRELKR